MPRLSQGTRGARRQQILDAARRCFTGNGFQATSMQNIFSEAGLSAGAVYSHFTGKDEIITAIAGEVIEKVISVTDTVPPEEEPPPLDEVLERTFAVFQEADIAAIAVVVWGEAIRDPLLGERLGDLYRTLADHFTRLVRGYQAAGAIDPGLPAEYPAWVLTALGPAFLHQLAFGVGIDPRDFARGLCALLRRLAAGPPRAAAPQAGRGGRYVPDPASRSAVISQPRPVSSRFGSNMAGPGRP